jgi:hypothetical protein
LKPCDGISDLVVPTTAVRAWQAREPQTWAMVCEWLAEQGKSVVQVLERRFPSLGPMCFVPGGICGLGVSVGTRGAEGFTATPVLSQQMTLF